MENPKHFGWLLAATCTIAVILAFMAYLVHKKYKCQCTPKTNLTGGGNLSTLNLETIH